MRTKCFAEEHNILTQPHLEFGFFDLYLSALTIHSPFLLLLAFNQNYNKNLMNVIGYNKILKNMIGYHQPDLSNNKTVYTSYL